MSFDVKSKEMLLQKSLYNFFSSKHNLDILLPILKHDSNISLRILDWLVTNYSKKYNIFFENYKNGVKTIFFVHLSYKNQLKAYSKKYFDPFCRRDRITVLLNEINSNYEGTLNTTIGQLNFFKWFIENKLLNYVVINVSKIDQDMNSTLNKKKIKNRKKELSQKNINLIMVPANTVVTFD